MAYLTPRKRATGMGSAKSGVEHFWNMKVSSIGLLILVPLFLFTFGPALGSSYEEMVAYYQHPFPAIVAILTLSVGFMHFKNGFQVLIEDYVHGAAGQYSIIAMNCLCYAAAATGIFSIIRIAL
ncbi:succinate dehydrogenase, hydrophobic membrane anchor protein [Donghicola tyrosinivorans]|jgi:succinate dehydrogenase / fumarate reductase membrane anchor subunit|uniref:Succinate dehydrogenase hydrophobic membrane anchor subunit n=1 Tax=Donghicola tyrosinivorans TaxID=1652492 RepID=A0A2T0X041_9RHOB|nr:succinate dehydrogenase, hydrophobic membrane anchor protein [Donghicola tyrosinivorans]MEE3070918.1 succinate dehydrogenase, hydrophobic membrane anchor protein [Pseudomonadota bacterium]PRY92311.1 succinate dehydrogenase / fumarate reductase membrane anchor subunit [Donghicola tyrosinivorans]